MAGRKSNSNKAEEIVRAREESLARFAERLRALSASGIDTPSFVKAWAKEKLNPVQQYQRALESAQSEFIRHALRQLDQARAGARKGGSKSKYSAKDHQTWMREAIELKMGNPSLSQLAIAKHIANRKNRSGKFRWQGKPERAIRLFLSKNLGK